MTYFKDPIITLCCSITSACLMLLIWPTLAYVTLVLIITYLTVKIIQNHPQKSKLIGQFLAEFFGFGLVLLLFASLLTIMGAFFA